MCSALEFIEVVVTLSYGKEQWEGVGYWPLPDQPGDWKKLIQVITESVYGGTILLFSTPTRAKMNVTGQVISVKGDLARKMLKHTSGKPLGAADWLTWSCKVSGDRWEVAHG